MSSANHKRRTITKGKGDSMKRVTRFIPAFIVLLATAPAFAASATSNFSVTATVTNNCTITTAAISFGSYDPVVVNVATPLDATGSVTVTCTKGATTTIGLNTGNNGPNATGTTRAMKAGTSYLSYEIYQETGRTTVWGNTGSALLTPAAAPDKNPRSFTTYGRIPGGQDQPSGAYTDSATATVNF